MAAKFKKRREPRKPRNPLAAQLWKQGLKVKPSAKTYSRKIKHRRAERG